MGISGIHAASILERNKISDSYIVQFSEKYSLVNIKTGEMLGIEIP